jgi:ATP-dependent Clp protease protease subunit
MSCGAILLTAGTEGYRFISPNSVVMIHDVSSVANGKFEEIVSDANETTRIQKLFYDTLDNNCKQDKGYFDKLVFNRGRADWYMNPEECKKHNVVDHIGLPMFTYEIKIKQTFGLQEPNS